MVGEDELADSAHVGGRTLVEQHRRVRSQAIGAVVFGEKAADYQEVTENARAAFRRAAARGDGLRGSVSFRYRGENFELNPGLERLGALIITKGVKYECR